METAEHFAHVSLVTELLGKQVLLSGGDVEKLLAARARYGSNRGVWPQLSGHRQIAADSERITLTARTGSADRGSSTQGSRASLNFVRGACSRFRDDRICILKCC